MYPWRKFLFSVQNIGLHGGTAFSHAWSLAVEDQFYLTLPFILLFVNRWPRPPVGRTRPAASAAIIISCAIFFGGILLRTFLAHQHPADISGVAFRDYQAWIYYPTWTRLDPLVFGVVLAAIEKFRPQWWQRLMKYAVWLWLPGLALIVFALWLGEGEYLEFSTVIWQFPLLAFGFAALLVCAQSDRLPLRHLRIPGVAFIASIAYSAYLDQKLVMHLVGQFCFDHDIALTSVPALLGVELCVYAAATILFFVVERPFLMLRHHRFLQLLAQRRVQRREHSVRRKPAARRNLQRLHRPPAPEIRDLNLVNFRASGALRVSIPDKARRILR